MFECRNCGVSKTLDEFYKRPDGHGIGHETTCKNCKNEKARLRKLANSDKYRKMGNKASAKWKENNPEKVKEQNKRFRENNPDYATKHRQENPEIYKKARDKHYYESGGREKTLDRNRKRRALVMGSRHEDYSVADVLSRYGEDCYLCGEAIDLTAPRWTKEKGWEKGLHIEHYVDIVLGGEDTLDNVRPSHGICNLQKQPRGEDVNV